MSTNNGLGDLMEAYLDGDVRAYRRLDARLRPRLTSTVRRIVGGTDVADDLVQAALIRAHRARGRFAPPGGDPDAAVARWYAAIARNAALDHLRARGVKSKRERQIKTAAIQWAAQKQGEDTEALALETEARVLRKEELANAIAALPAPSRSVIEGRLRGETMSEISKRLGLHHGTVRVRAHRAYKALAAAANMAA